MLSKLILLNSAKFSKAILDFEKGIDTVQLVGGNRFGKTSLLNSLNFLFVPDARQLGTLFGDHSYQQTLSYYFPREEESFILYQIYKNGFFTIIVKTDNGKLSYYKYNQEFKEEHFFTDSNKLLKFKEIQTRFLQNGIELQRIPNSQDYLQFAYSRDKRNNSCVVWLEKTVKSRGLNNPFTEMYKCLIKPKLINNDTLKQALIIADNKSEQYDLEFSKDKGEDLAKLKRYADEVQRIKEIKDEFFIFKKLVEDFDTKQGIIDELYFTFSLLFEFEIKQIETDLKYCDIEKKLLENKIRNTLRPEERQLSEQKGGKKTEIGTQETAQKKLENKLKQIEKIEPLNFLVQQLENLDKERGEIEYNLTNIDKEKSTKASVLAEIGQLEAAIKNTEGDISGNSQQLIQHISNDEHTRQLLNRILSDEIKRLTIEHIFSNITNITNPLSIADGKIDISGINPLPFATIEELSEKLAQEMNKLSLLRKKIEVIEKRDEFEKKLKQKKEDISEVNNKISLLNEEQNIRAELASIKLKIKGLNAVIIELEKKIAQLNDEITDTANEIENYKSKEIEKVNRRRFLLDKEGELRQKNIIPSSCQSERTNIDEIIKELFRNISEVERLKERKNERLNDLKRRSGKDLAEPIFIQEIEEDITTIQQKEESISGLLQSVSQLFSNPADRLLKAFQEFQDTFIRPFNTQLSKIRISDIQEIKLTIKPTDTDGSDSLIKKIQAISAIQKLEPMDLFFQQVDSKDGLALLGEWLRIEKKIRFEDLFEINAEIIENDKKKSIDFSKEIESGGTNRMIKFIVFLSVIKKLIVSSADNRIPFCIDETLMIDTQNQEEIIRFCKENHFLPILAAPDPVKSNIDRFYYLTPNMKGDKMFVINKKK